MGFTVIFIGFLLLSDNTSENLSAGSVAETTAMKSNGESLSRTLSAGKARVSVSAGKAAQGAVLVPTRKSQRYAKSQPDDMDFRPVSSVLSHRPSGPIGDKKSGTLGQIQVEDKTRAATISAVETAYALLDLELLLGDDAEDLQGQSRRMMFHVMDSTYFKIFLALTTIGSILLVAVETDSTPRAASCPCSGSGWCVPCRL